jgi:hypothetical protein
LIKIEYEEKVDNKYYLLFYNLAQQFLQNLASFSFAVLHFLQILFFQFKSIIFVDSINIITVIVERIVTSIGPKNIKNQARNFDIPRLGTISPYQTVVIVTTHHQRVCGIEVNTSLFQKLNSSKYIIVENTTKTIDITKIAAKYSILCVLNHFKSFKAIGIFSINSNILKTLKILKIAKIVYESIQYTKTK